MVLKSVSLSLSSIFLLAAIGKADFSVFYGTLTMYGSPTTENFFFMTNPPDCDDFGSVTSYLGQVDDYAGSAVGAQGECTDGVGINQDGCELSFLKWNDDDDHVDYGQITSCALGDGAGIQQNSVGSYDLVDSTGAVRGNCVVPSDPQDVDCPADPVDFSGFQIFQCTSDCTLLGSN